MWICAQPGPLCPRGSHHSSVASLKLSIPSAGKQPYDPAEWPGQQIQLVVMGAGSPTEQQPAARS